MSNREQIMRMIQSLSVEDRATLAAEILRDLHRTPLAPPPRNTLAKARGLFRTDAPPPSDEDVDRIIEEHRLQKYGGR
jgi:hypothetical protein